MNRQHIDMMIKKTADAVDFYWSGEDGYGGYEEAYAHYREEDHKVIIATNVVLDQFEPEVFEEELVKLIEESKAEKIAICDRVLETLK